MMANPWMWFKAGLDSLAHPAPRREEHELCSFDSMFGPARVFETVDDDGLEIRVLEVNGAWESASYRGDGYAELAFPYHRLYNRLFEARPMATHFLMLGGGGFSYPKYLLAHTHDTTIDVVEIDPEIARVGRVMLYLKRAEAEYDLAGTRFKLHVEDGLQFLRETDRAFDVILNDAFCADAPAKGLLSEEGVNLAHERLVPNGLYVLNVVSAREGARSRPLKQVSRPLARRFAHLYLIPCSPDEPQITDNNVLIACDEECAFTGAEELSVER